ncbi:Reh1p Ecym_3276 [Eremothecium cymbalariae DBVPG|uniref:C2H2-type domain-containing protein n=1 Tax=Eremothecium cymbalariae (strain CBS 270.75 / DBVPG 7215 / KCTC 17166 / NRRL Y-17582) TaxID=931890 RepID=G8JRK0_ERECY|nr:Hypothetical protein Ecym_3276 [Eremothecium cymbalariae DBVPG\
MDSPVIFTCNSCMIQFKSSELQRYHMKTEWHRYNLKRRITALPPISSDVFLQKLQVSQREQELHQVDEFGFPVLKPIDNSAGNENKNARKYRGRCKDTVTNKSKRSASPASSITSRVSKISVRSTDYDEASASEYGFTTEDSHYESDSVSSSDFNGKDEQMVRVSDCIFCDVQYEDVDRNLRHMLQFHGLYIPERSYLVDLPGLLHYLLEIIVVNMQCLCCSFQGVGIESIRTHMAAKGHCRIPYESKEERSKIASFYDFSLASAETTTPKSCNTEKKISFKDSAEYIPIETEENSISKELNANNGEDINTNISVVQVDSSGVELMLPTGTKIGHRCMQRYYRQNVLHPAQESDGVRTVAISHSRSVPGVTEKEFKRNNKQMKKLERLDHTKEEHKHLKRANFQKYHRDELLQ